MSDYFYTFTLPLKLHRNFLSTFIVFFNHRECTLRLFPDGLITLDIVQYIKDVSEEKLLCRQVILWYIFR